jgi:GNAT superfamily N-acetyltransferase
MSVTILPLSASDKDDWRSLWHDYLAFYETDVADEVYENTFSRLTDPSNHQQHALIARQDTGPVGLVHYIYHPHNWRIENVCYLQDLYVSADVRNQGLGRALIEAVYTEAQNQGVDNVYWLTQDFNHSARKLYDKVAELTPFIKYQKS